MSAAAEVEGKRTKKEQIALATRLVVGALGLAAVIWFAVTNSQRVTVEWFVVETRSRLFVVILVSAVLGALVDRAIRWRRQRREQKLATAWLRARRKSSP